MSGHTPTPWVVHEDETTIKTLDGLLITDVGASFSGELEANAAFIVRAVNAHEALVEALKDAIESTELAHLRARWGGILALASPAAPADMEKQS